MLDRRARPFRLASFASIGALALATLVASGCTLPASDEDAATSGESALIGGTAESRFQAAGYVTKADGSSGALCGATLVAPDVVVTAAHCVHREGATPLAFGVGEIRAARRVAVKEVHLHPQARVTADGMMDKIRQTMRLYDLAYLVLERPVEGVIPARPNLESPAWLSCDTRIVGYGSAPDGTNRRSSVGGCVVLKPTLAGDNILEIRPDTGGAVCHRDGDEGHPAIRDGEGGVPVLVGIYVGSVTQSFTDCRRYVQLLNGYENVAGHADFFAEAIRASAAGP